MLCGLHTVTASAKALQILGGAITAASLGPDMVDTNSRAGGLARSTDGNPNNRNTIENLDP